MKRKTDLLSLSSFSILMALSLKPRHGYEIMQQVREDSLGKVTLGPAALYTATKQLCEAGLIKELASEFSDRRRFYQLTLKGRHRLQADLEYFHYILQLAGQRTVHPHTKSSYALIWQRA